MPIWLSISVNQKDCTKQKTILKRQLEQSIVSGIYILYTTSNQHHNIDSMLNPITPA